MSDGEGKKSGGYGREEVALGDNVGSRVVAGDGIKVPDEGNVVLHFENK